MGARDRVRRALGRAWFRGIDYAWALREIGGGLASPRLPEAYGRGVRAPVLLLPGVLEDWTMMRRVADRLSGLGHPIHALPELRRNTVTVPQASALGTAYLAAHDLRGAVLVAHSKGGLIGKHMMVGDAEHRIASMIAIATPFAGSVLARLIPHAAVRALDPQDATILALARHREVDRRITSVYPAFDPHIPGGSRLDGAVNVPIRTAGHFRILGDAAVLGAVAAAVGGDQASPSGGGA